MLICYLLKLPSKWTEAGEQGIFVPDAFLDVVFAIMGSIVSQKLSFNNC